MKNIFLRWCALGLGLLCLSTQAATLVVGDAVPTIAAADQRGVAFQFTNGVRFLLVVTEMACSKTANQKLAAEGAGFLEKHQAAYLMDIHTMPAIGRFFALPKMKKYPQRIVLVDNAETLATFPAQPERVTVLAISPAGRVEKISFWDPASEPVAGFLE
jgi:hypothetical protein